MSRAVVFLCPQCHRGRKLAFHPGPDKVRCIECECVFRTDGFLYDAAEWPRIESPHDAARVAETMGAPLSDRKWRLLAVAVGRAEFDWCRNPWFRDALQSAERWADEGTPPRGIDLCRRHLDRVAPPPVLDENTPVDTWYSEPDLAYQRQQAREQFAWVALARRCIDLKPQLQRGDVPRTFRPLVATLVRELVPNPFRLPAWNPDWLTSTVRDLARTMYDRREFSGMPILADALQDAGCDNSDILNHCQTSGSHYRGCWVVDAILGKS